MTLIIKKIDNLGRIVIPKEIRKRMNIKEDDELEINIEKEWIVLKKYYMVKNNIEKFESVFDLLKKVIEFEYLVSDRENIIFCDEKNNKYQFDKVTKKILEIIEERKKINNFYCNKNEIVNDYNDEGYFCIHPIIVEANVKGCLIAIKKEQFTEKELIILDILIIMINKQLE